MSTELEHLQKCVLCCLLQNPEDVIPLCQEFNLSPSDFEDHELAHRFNIAMSHSKPSLTTDWLYWYLPTSRNARYYIESLHNLLRQT